MDFTRVASTLGHGHGSCTSNNCKDVDDTAMQHKLLWGDGFLSTARSTRHPLDPLTRAEIAVAVATVKAAATTPQAREGMRFVEAVLKEPEKRVVALADAVSRSNGYSRLPSKDDDDQSSKEKLRSKEGVIGGEADLRRSNFTAPPLSSPPAASRQARVVVYNRNNNETSIWIVELPTTEANYDGEATAMASPSSEYSGHRTFAPKILSSHIVPDVQPAVDAQEFVECEAAVKAYGPFREAMKKRGIDDMELVMVDPWCAGYHGEEDGPDRRLAKPLIFCKAVSEEIQRMENGYARPVEGMRVVVDMQRMAVVEFEEELRHVPLPHPDPLRNYSTVVPRSPGPRPLLISQPHGPTFIVDGYAVHWQKWNFRIGFTPREGLVIHSVAYDDDSRGRRYIAHRLSFVEMVVPYGDPHEPHYRKNAFDAGEDGLGKNAHSLKRGCDCVGYVKYFDAHMTNFSGGVETIENCVCLHEEDFGILWKHKDWRTGRSEVRRSRRLSVSFFCTVANYEYGFFWHFYQDGKIEAEVKLTGILSVGALRPGETRKHGTVIAPGLYAPVHQHFFVARLDMGVDSEPGEACNQVVEVNVKAQDSGPDNIHNNAFYAEETVLESELKAMRDCHPLSSRFWIVRNTRMGAVNRSGQPTGYKLVPGRNCLPMVAGSEAAFLRRAGFLEHNLWVTAYEPSHLFPAGEFPNQSPRLHEGLPTWVQRDADLLDSDIVLWYVFGVTHVPRLEDWPVMPVEHIGFSLMPHGFFNCSPAIDVPPSSSGAS